MTIDYKVVGFCAKKMTLINTKAIFNINPTTQPLNSPV